MAAFIKRLRQICQTRYSEPAFYFDHRQISLGEVERLSNQIARWLTSTLPDSAQVIGLHSCVSLVTGPLVLGIMKAGKVFLGLDPAYPTERIVYMTREANCALVISDGFQDATLFGSTRVIDIDSILRDADSLPTTPFDIPSVPEQPAYIVFTSGSTGRPKAVLAPVQQIDNRFAWMWETNPFSQNEVCCQRMPLSFIDFIWEILGPLCAGVPTAILSRESTSNLAMLVEELAIYRVSRLWLLPATLNALIGVHPNLTALLPHLRFWVCTGDSLSPALVAAFYRAMPAARLYNLYGTSEVWDVTWQEVSDKDRRGLLVPIGTPIRDTTVIIVDDQRRTVARGAVGEIAIGGAALALGYASRPPGPALKPFAIQLATRPGEYYLTGDMGFVGPEGEIFYLGRRHAVRQNGSGWVSLIEIEAAITLHPAVMDGAAVFLSGSTEGVLATEGYYTCRRGHSVSPSELMRFIRKLLGENILPGQLHRLDRFSMTPSGKIDRKQLRSPVTIDVSRMPDLVE